MYALTHAQIHTGSQCLTDHALLIEDDRITGLRSLSELDPALPCHDLAGAHLTAGFIDLQINGCGGVLFNNTPTRATLQTMHEANLRSGTTSFLPTLISAPDETIRQALSAVKDFMTAQSDLVLGMHLEGPYTNPQRKGIHPLAQLRHPDDSMIDFLCQQAPWLRKVTLAPEQNHPEHIRRLTDAGILVSLGHSAANYQEAMAGFAAGIGFATHLYNAMTPTLNGREPGVVGAIYDHPDVRAGIVVDGYHVHWANVRLAHKVMGARLCLVTDAVAPAGAPAGFDHFDFCGTQVFYRDGKCVDANGTLGGSALTMIEGVANLVRHVGLPLDEALRMASLYPAKALGIAERVGNIGIGKLANLTVFDDEFRVRATVVKGHYQEHRT